MSHTMTSQVFLSATRLLALLETFAGVPDRQVDTLGGGAGRISTSSSASASASSSSARLAR